MTTKEEAGEVQGADVSAREKLLEAGRYLFLRQEFHRVSIRRIAERAGVNSAMIAYYFGDKRGLFQAVVMSYITPMKGYLLEGLQQMPRQSFGDIFRFYFRHAPRELIQIVIKSLLYDPGDQGRWLVENILRPLLTEVERQLDQVLPRGREHQPEFARLMIQSLLIFPVLMKPSLETLSQHTMDETYYDELADYIGTMLDRAFDMENAQ